MHISKGHEEIMKSRLLSTASDDRLESLMIIALHKYPWKGFEPTTVWSTDSLTIRNPPLLANLKMLNLRQCNQSGFSNPLKTIASYKHSQVPQVYAPPWLATLQVSNCFAESTRGNHEITFRINSDG